MTNTTKLAGRAAGRVVPSCLIAVSESKLRGIGLSGVRGLGRDVRDVRPTKAFVVAAAQGSAYAPVVAGADLQQQACAIDAAASGVAAATQHKWMRAFRGPEPWKEPS